jgi:hypothetical protein
LSTKLGILSRPVYWDQEKVFEETRVQKSPVILSHKGEDRECE